VKKSFCTTKKGYQIEEAAHRMGEKTFAAIHLIKG
jgi:hypothetical protein